MSKALEKIRRAARAVATRGCNMAADVKNRPKPSQKEVPRQVSITLEDMGITELNEVFDSKKRVLYNRGREDYFDFIITTFQKMKKHNLIIIGSPGVGKEALIEGVAERIVKRQVPEALRNKVVWKIDIDKFLTGDYIDTGIPDRLKLLHDILLKTQNVILYIYPLEVLPVYNAVNDIAQAIAGTNTLVVGTLTQKDFTEYSELFEASFATETVDVLNVVEPKLEEVYDILKFKLRDYTRHYGIKMSRKAFDKCLSEVYRLTVADLDLDMLLDYIDTALCIAKQAGKTELDYQSILSVQKFQVREVYELPAEARMKLAMHEASHAVVGFAVANPPKTISIIPGESYLGINLFEEKYRPMTKPEYIDMIAVYVAPIAYNQLIGGEENNETGADLRLATNKAKNMILNFAMGRHDSKFLGKYQNYVVSGIFQDEIMTEAQREETTTLVNTIMETALDRAKRILSDETIGEAQKTIAEALCQNASLTEDEARGLYDGTITIADLEDANIAKIFE